LPGGERRRIESLDPGDRRLGTSSGAAAARSGSGHLYVLIPVAGRGCIDPLLRFDETAEIRILHFKTLDKRKKQWEVI
jgi:hypothetical protein